MGIVRCQEKSQKLIDKMLIGELSKQTRLSGGCDSVYQKHALIKSSQKSQTGNNYKEYSDDMLKRCIW